MHRINKRTVLYLLAGLLVSGLAGCGVRDDIVLLSEPELPIQEEGTVTTEDQSVSSESTADILYVFICGQVQKPGVYCLPSGSRIVDLIELAGGCLEGADICAVNQAEKLVDGSQVYIPAVGETETGASEVISDGLVHLNRADKEELMTLPGIGETKAELILEYRETRGGFATVDEIMNIPGIKEGVFRKIQDYITVE